ncbi:MAG: hypothetical protein Q8O89_03820, partial [Nanoarchaeota archaeon]|nr:hypothetical protein [Nanoarchaeota archaeon]
MKHTFKVTITLLLMFLFAQLIGLAIVNKYVNADVSRPSGNIDFETISPEVKENITWTQLPFNMERPEVEEGFSFIYLLIAVAIGTILTLFLIKRNSTLIWKFWFFLSVWISLGISFTAFIPQLIAGIAALILALLKIFRRNIFIHNLTEL